VLGVGRRKVYHLSVLLLISNLDRPFSGLLALKPSAMQNTEQDIREDYAAAYRGRTTL